MSHSYVAGRFTIPPSFDFKILPNKSKNVAVISIIGSADSLNQRFTTELVDDFLGQFPFSLQCVKSVITGYYDCERQLIFLHYRDTEKLFTELMEHSNNYGGVLEDFDSERLKCVYFLFQVSHFLIVSTFGTALDTRYVSLLKLINHLRNAFCPLVENLVRAIPLPRYCMSLGRIALPRLLFVFKLPPTIAVRKMVLNRDSLLQFERNLSLQIYNVFKESGLFTGAPGDRLFDLKGYSYVSTLLPDALEGPTSHSSSTNLAQFYLEELVADLPEGPLDFCGDVSETICNRKAQPPCNLYAPPSAPDKRGFQAFLQCTLSSFMEEVATDEKTDSNSVELPSGKSWFITCYKLYCSLFANVDAAATGVGGEEGTDVTVSHRWNQIFSDEGDSTPSATGAGQLRLAASQAQVDRKLSAVCCESALTASEAHYREAMPPHYSRTFHIAKVISSYNVLLSLARGPSVLSSLEQLTRRLARLYLSVRVGCPALLASGHPCRQELHTEPERFPGLARALLAVQETGGGEAGGQTVPPVVRLIKFLKNARKESLSGLRGDKGRKRVKVRDSVLADCLQDMPPGLVGRWRYAWLEAAAAEMEAVRGRLVLSTVERLTASGVLPLSSPDAGKPIEGRSDVKNNEELLEAGARSCLQHLSVMPHRSGRRLVSYCNCGRMQALRVDPFDYIDANWVFYNVLEAVCCFRASAIPLAPLFLVSGEHNFSVRLLDDEEEEEVEDYDDNFDVEYDDSPAPLSYDGLSQRNEPNTEIIDVVNYGSEGICAPRPLAELGLEVVQKGEVEKKQEEFGTESVETSLEENEDEKFFDARETFGLISEKYTSPLKLTSDSLSTGASSQASHDVTSQGNLAIPSGSQNSPAAVTSEAIKQDKASPKGLADVTTGQVKKPVVASEKATLNEQNEGERNPIITSTASAEHTTQDNRNENERRAESVVMATAECRDIEVMSDGAKKTPEVEPAADVTKVQSPTKPPKAKSVPVRFFSGVPLVGQPIGSMPLYPSWSIYALGRYFSYSHASGLILPGFLRGSQFLLPWDIQLSPFAPSSTNKGSGGGSRIGRSAREPTSTAESVKLFIGFEMECPLGHRFLLSAPNRPQQTGSAGSSVSSLLHSDLALYLPCPCSYSVSAAGGDNNSHEREPTRKRRDERVWAQLMRVYVAIPSGRVRVKFTPRVRAAPAETGTPIFHLGRTLDQEADAKAVGSGDGLPKGSPSPSSSKGYRNSEAGYVYLRDGIFWVIRLPFVYQDGVTIYRRPENPDQIRDCCLLRGSLSVEES